MRKSTRIAAVLVLAASALLVLRAWSGSRIPFPHAVHQQAGLDCAACHAAAESKNLKKSLLPASDACGSCHEKTDFEKWGYSRMPRRHTGFRKFSHEAHLSAGLKCQDCHVAMAAAVGTVERPSAGHETCFRCHDGVQHSNACKDCHSDLRQGRLNGFERDPSIMKPMDHHPGFLHSHQFEAQLAGKKCEECHRQEDFCSTCHEGPNVEMMVHERNWLYTHPVAAQKNLANCRSCHEIETFCEDCHVAQGVEPVSHQTSWASAGGGPAANRHAVEARRDIGACAACHETDGDAVCARCHRDDGIRGNQPELNPHPPGFRQDAGHGYWHEDDAAACFACHTDTHLAGQGFCGYCHGKKN